jgi:hypothetical protein
MGRGSRQLDEVAGLVGHLAEECLDCAGTGLHEDALVPHRVAVVRGHLAGHRVGDADVAVAQHESPVVDDVHALPLLTGNEVGQAQVSWAQRVVGHRGRVGQLPDLGVDDRRWHAAVVQQRGVGREALLTHELLAQQGTVRALPVLGVPLGWDQTR